MLKNKKLDNEAESKTVIIPARVLREMAKLVSAHETQNVKIAISDNRILFRTGTVQMISNIIEGKFPDVQRVIPQIFDILPRLKSWDSRIQTILAS